MTKETFEYEIETCDICKHKVKKEPKKKDPKPFITYSSYSIQCTADWTSPFIKQEYKEPEHIDMCESCTNSFNKWRANRENRCGCADY